MKHHSDHRNMKSKRKFIHFLSFALVNIFLMNTCVQTLVSELSLHNSKISQHQTAKKADTPVVEEDNENEEKEESVVIGDWAFFLQHVLISDHQFTQEKIHPFRKCITTPMEALFLKNRMMRI